MIYYILIRMKRFKVTKSKLINIVLFFILQSNISYSQGIYKFKNKSSDNQYGVLDSKGGIIIKNEYLDIHEENSFILGKQENKKGFTIFDINGKLLKKDIASYQLLGNQNIFLKEYNNSGTGKWALYIINGVKQNTYIYDDILWSSSSLNFAQVLIDVEYCFINSSGKVLYSDTNKIKFRKYVEDYYKKHNISETVEAESELTYFRNNFKTFQDKETMKWGIMDGKAVLIDADYDNIKSIPSDEEGLFYNFIVMKDKKYGVFNNEGVKILNYEFDKIDKICSSKIFAIYNQKYGVYNSENGDEILPPKYGFLSFLND